MHSISTRNHEGSTTRVRVFLPNATPAIRSRCKVAGYSRSARDLANATASLPDRNTASHLPSTIDEELSSTFAKHHDQSSVRILKLNHMVW